MNSFIDHIIALYVSIHFADYQLFLTSLLSKEVASLPRGIGRGTTAKTLGSSYDRFLKDIPPFLLKQYETSRRPAVVPGIAGKPRNFLMRALNVIEILNGVEIFNLIC